METGSTNRLTSEVFTLLMRTLNPEFKFPGGAVARKCVDSCLDTLQERYISLGSERIVDFCICQVYALSRFGAEYLRRWRVNHSFGGKALNRYATQTNAHRHYQDCWLKGIGYTRSGLQYLFTNRAHHPLAKFIYPEYEDATKRRLQGTTAGFCICQMSTLLWTPFSPVCQKCPFSKRCRAITAHKHHELYRLRVEQYKERRKHGEQ